MNMSKLNISRMLTLSTCHITKEEDDLLDKIVRGQWPVPENIPEIHIEAVDYGWLVWMTPAYPIRSHQDSADYVLTLLEAGFGRPFCICVSLALTSECEYLRLDPDVEPTEGMLEFDW